jgi:hypothetical protein
MSVIAYNLLKCIDYLDLKGRCAFPIALRTRITLVTRIKLELNYGRELHFLHELNYKTNCIKEANYTFYTNSTITRITLITPIKL